MYFLSAFFCGLLFGAGLTISNMVNPNKVLDFLNITGHWDPSLALVMASALLITAVGYRLLFKKGGSEFLKNCHLPSQKTVDKPLIFGSMLFGVGWGLAGYCPGPAVSALGLGIMDSVYFIAGMLVFELLLWIKSRHSS